MGAPRDHAGVGGYGSPGGPRPWAGVDVVGDAAGGLDAASVRHGRLSGCVDTLLWIQQELQLKLEKASADRFADTRPLLALLATVQDSIRQVQDGTGDPNGLVRTIVGEQVTPGGVTDEIPGG